jgi:hypothetical protein
VPPPLQVELEAFALEDQQQQPPEERERSQHRRERSRAGERGHAGDGLVLVDEVGGGMRAHELPQELLLLLGRAAQSVGADHGLEPVELVEEMLRLLAPVFGSAFRGRDRLEERRSHRELPRVDDVHALRFLDGGVEGDGGEHVDDDREEGAEGEPQRDERVAGLLRPLLEQLLLPPLPASRATSGRAEEERDGAPRGRRIRGRRRQRHGRRRRW